MIKNVVIGKIRASEKFFDASTGCLEEEHSGYRPKEEMLTVAQHVYHAALSVDWFLDGAFSPEGFSMDFEEHHRKVAQMTSLGAARRALAEAYGRVYSALESSSEGELEVPLPKSGVMDGEPRWAAISGIEEHTGHHRGSLAVYSRLLGLEPAVPYQPADAEEGQP